MLEEVVLTLESSFAVFSLGSLLSFSEIVSKAEFLVAVLTVEDSSTIMSLSNLSAKEFLHKISYCVLWPH